MTDIEQAMIVINEQLPLTAFQGRITNLLLERMSEVSIESEDQSIGFDGDFNEKEELIFLFKGETYLNQITIEKQMTVRFSWTVDEKPSTINFLFFEGTDNDEDINLIVKLFLYDEPTKDGN